jgi:AcrR family transcriptional regulator
LYHYYPTKESLLVELMDQGLDPLIEATRSMSFDSNLTPKDRLRKMVETFVVFVAENADLAILADTELRSLSDAARGRIVEKRDELERLYGDAIASVSQEFDSRDPERVEVRLRVFGLLAMMNAVAVWFRPNGELGAKDVARQYGALAICLSACQGNDELPPAR